MDAETWKASVRVLAASVTPLLAEGAAPDYAAIPSLVEFLASSGLDGIFALGTTGEGLLFDVSERQRVAEGFVAAARGRLRIVVQCGAQTTRDTAALAAHAAAIGADAAAVIAPPYFALDRTALIHHFTEAARACAPLPFFVYEFAARSGYAVPVDVIAELRQQLPNLVGLKVSDTPWERFEPYLIDGLAVYAGPEGLIRRALERDAAGAVSGLAAALPEVVVALVRNPTVEGAQAVATLQREIGTFPFQAALKVLLTHRGVAIGEAVRAPLRTLNASERASIERLIPDFISTAEAAVSSAPRPPMETSSR